jgi:hypothetical protein
MLRDGGQQVANGENQQMGKWQTGRLVWRMIGMVVVGVCLLSISILAHLFYYCQVR